MAARPQRRRSPCAEGGPPVGSRPFRQPPPERQSPERSNVTTPSALLKVMIDAVRKTARGLTRDFGEVAELQVSKKGAADFVSAADLKAEQTLFEELSRVRPGYGFFAEERGEIPGSDKTHR